MTHTDDKEIQATKRLMAALGRMPPKPHSEMKLGKSRRKAGKSPKGTTSQSKK